MQWARTIHGELLMRQETGVVVIQAFVARAQRLDIAEAVEQDEGLLVLEDLRIVFGTRRGRGDVPPVSDLYAVRHPAPVHDPGNG